MSDWQLGPGLFGGWKGPDPNDSRDFLVGRNARKLSLPYTLPTLADNLHLFVDQLYDQLSLGSCVAWGFRRNMESVSKKAGHEHQPFSALGAYKVAQEVAGWPIDQDTGLYLRDMVKAIRGRGIGREEDWPYDLTKAFQRPGSEYYLRASWYRNRVFYRIESNLEMKAVLAAGHTVVIGVAIAANFFQAQGSGRIPMPGKGDWIGGHCWAIGAYQDDASWPGGGYYIGPNSWKDWTTFVWNGRSLPGMLAMPYAYMDVAEGFPDAWCGAWVEAEQPPQQ